MHWSDWSIFLGFSFFLLITAVYTKRYALSVADFLAANRCAGRYLLCVSDDVAAFAGITIVAMWEIYYVTGFAVVWWDMMRAMVLPTILCLSGWIIYRFRQTRALTLGQFIELRYSKRLRIFTGFLAWMAGIINFGIFPAVGTRFFLYFLGIPETVITFGLTMAVLLGLALFFTFSGGQITVMVTDFVQGIFCSIMFIVILVFLFYYFSWEQVTTALAETSSKASMLHPFRISDAEDFNMTFFMMWAFMYIYNCNIWQGRQGYNAAALNPHEARMGRIWGTWRLLIRVIFLLVVPICAFTFMHHADFSSLSEAPKNVLSGIQNEVIRDQTTTTVILRYMLPAGIAGGLLTIFISAFISTHTTYLHSWGSIFIQDVILPLKKKTLSPEQHIKWLRFSIIGVAVFIFLFSFIVKQTGYIMPFLYLTGSIYFSGAGIVVIGGLYWKRGTVPAAWIGLITGSSIALITLLMRQVHEILPFSNKFVVYIVTKNGTVLSFWASVTAIIVYIVVSLTGLGQRKKFNMDKLLHRGEYAIESDQLIGNEPVMGWRKLIGINKDFNRIDRFVYLGTVIWTLLWFIIIIVVTAYNFICDVSVEAWIDFWYFFILLHFFLGITVTIWITIGGMKDLRNLFARLRIVQRNELDDGRVEEYLKE